MPNAVNEAPAIFRIPTAFVAALITTAGAATVVQVVHSATVLRALGAPVDAAQMLGMLGHDLLEFGPNFMGIAAVGFLIAFVVTAGLRRVVSLAMRPIHALAGGVAIFTALASIQALTGIAPIPASLHLGWLAALVATGAAGGWVYGWLAQSSAEAASA
jgi:hypothetical protein